MQRGIRFLYLLVLMILPVTVSGTVKGRLTVLEGNASIRMIFQEESHGGEEPPKILTSFHHSADDYATWGDPGGLAFNDSPPKLRSKAFDQLKELLSKGEKFTFTQVIIGIAGISHKDNLASDGKSTKEEFHKQNYATLLNVDQGIIHLINDSDLVLETAKVFSTKMGYKESPLVLQLTTFAYGYKVNGKESKESLDYFHDGKKGASWQFGNLVYNDKNTMTDKFFSYKEDLTNYVNSELKKTVKTQDRLLKEQKRMNVLGFLSMKLAEWEGIKKDTKEYLAEKEALLLPAVQYVASQLDATDPDKKQPLIVIAGAEYPLNIVQFEGKLLTQDPPRHQGFCQGGHFLDCLSIAGANIGSHLKKTAEALNPSVKIDIQDND